ncbi:carboxypeptidase regulatory-like domain-containing protein [Acidobacteria bacterium AB60]|nr:carboxypeptidase regulatory-like domain-containing protein [Acidobacteria bacterium AB60]
MCRARWGTGLRSATRAGIDVLTIASDAARSPLTVILRRVHLALFVLLTGLVSAPLHGASTATVTGTVRDSGGNPQIGTMVQLLRPDLSVITSAYTNQKGHFSFELVSPGKYAVKAMGASFLPSLRENVRVHANTVVNLTLNTLYEVMQWLPAEPRSADARKDDWAWTLRSPANRPLLRWLEDGPLVVVSEGPNAAPKLKARLTAVGQEGSFGEDGQRISVEVQETPSNSRELLASVDFAPGTDGRMRSALGFRQDLGFAGSVQSLAAVAIHPEVEASGAEGLDEAAMRTWQTMNLGDEFEVETGAEQVLARFAQGGTNTVFAALPFMTLGWRGGDSTVRYRVATAVPGIGGETAGDAAMPALAMRNGSLRLEHGLHQEISWERQTDASGMSVLVYRDSLSNPVIEATVPGGVDGLDTAGEGLVDHASGLLRAAGPEYNSAGVVAAVERRTASGNSVRLSYANGDALVMPAEQHPTPLGLLIAAAHPRRTQMYSISLSGTLDGTGTRWRASYRWQPENTVTRVAPFAKDAAEPYLNIHLRQPVCLRRNGVRSLEAMFDMRNILEQGDRPFVLKDGSLLVFAQDQRSVSAGLAFTF